MNACITELGGRLSQKEALDIYKQIRSLPPARFATRRLHLPCIVFPVRGLAVQEISGSYEKLCRAKVSGLGNVEFTTTDDLPRNKQQKIVFAHPWIHHILGPNSVVGWGSDSESDTDSDLDCDTALQMIARLGQPFNALLLVQQPNRGYKRVAADKEIVVSGLGTNVAPKNIRAKVLEIL
ncbi:hypothetical protein PISMIDRAFT_104423 [Pisolithus microcarpus 441]|uniref:Uncharacterized protein n=1 Tax=Pisolithus microcarpus 441 TaxID=765257 RepID=A0A0C9Z4U7_9AGAM|nr:hypothetical protein PISMIDRAFT_104423 [Pisolithus microcarpus 441]